MHSRPDTTVTQERGWEPAAEPDPSFVDEESLPPTLEQVLHVVPYGDGWGIRVGSGDVERVFRSREEAFRNARAWATREDRWVVVHGEDGPIEGPAPV